MADPSQNKAQRTRGRILAAAEQHFSEHGFHEARLEDIAEDVGVKRAALFYHFRDKRELYESVLTDVFGALLAHAQEILARDEPIAARIEAGVAAWVAQVAARPAIPRLILREAANAEDLRLAFSPTLEPVLEWLRQEIHEATQRGEIRPAEPDPFQLVSAIVGATVFHVAARPRILRGERSAGSDEALAGHRRSLLRMTRRLMGSDAGDEPAATR